MKKILLLLTLTSALLYAPTTFAQKSQNVQAPKKVQKVQKKVEVYPWTISSLPEKFNKDWANFKRYAKANAEVKKAPIAVFMGDSITDFWAKRHSDFFKNNNFIGRGISGQVTAQMLTRFRRDVVDLKPKFVLILAGTNDVARNDGYISNENIVGNIISMCEISKANKITPVICSVLPAAEYPWRKMINSVDAIKKINDMLKKYAEENGIAYIDYYSSMVDEKFGLPKKYANDGIHPTSEGYVVMEKIVLDFFGKPQVDVTPVSMRKGKVARRVGGK